MKNLNINSVRFFIIILSLICLIQTSVYAEVRKYEDCLRELRTPEADGETIISQNDIVYCMIWVQNLMKDEELVQIYKQHIDWFGNNLLKIVKEDETKKIVETKADPNNKNKIENEVNKIANNRWNDLIDVLVKTCEGDSSDNNPWELKDSEDRYFRKINDMYRRYQSLSTPESLFTEFHAKSFLKLYQVKQDVPCEQLKDKIGKFSDNYKEFLRSVNQGSPNLNTLKNDFSELDALMFYKIFIHNLSYYYAYSVVIDYYQLIRSALVGLRPDEVSHAAVLINSMFNFANVENITDLYAIRSKTAYYINQVLQLTLDETVDYEGNRIGARER